VIPDKNGLDYAELNVVKFNTPKLHIAERKEVMNFADRNDVTPDKQKLV
jgi:hypothetical protein